MPKLIKRQRTKGWRAPANTVYIGRPSIYSNPWAAGDTGFLLGGKPLTPQNAVTLFEDWLAGRLIPYSQRFSAIELRDRRGEILRRLPSLKGKDIMCWCDDWELGQLPEPACHGVVLMQLANRRSDNVET